MSGIGICAGVDVALRTTDRCTSCMSFPLGVLWFSFGTSCVATALLACYAPGLKPLGRHPRDVPAFVALGLGVGLVLHAPYFAAPLAWETKLRLLPIALTLPHVTLVVVLLTSFRWLKRMLTLEHGSGRRRLVAFVLAWVGVLGYCAPCAVYLAAERCGW